MSNKMSRIFIILSLIVLAGCSQSLDIQLEPEVSVVLSDDREKVLRLTSNDKAYTDLNQWLREHNSDWYSTSGRYPGGVYIKSGDDGIQVTETHVVLYSTTGSEPKAIYIQTHEKDELTEVRNIGQ
ncbi:hypothetical protein [Motiliproteus sp. MSK22-1]|uniref:hypothetical protein n=1 Tax=Motiliproteus sp. MSK22-1 TaxID=1897630 RepID=UPI000976A26D|nr:hypothetical protein [Motiliproteus sp. MSK22-1]OMH29448.1 hypothetical protein BGP75_19545 [Motiliproteus sp. MSK22-1]